jgi:hypothetical protein
VINNCWVFFEKENKELLLVKRVVLGETKKKDDKYLLMVLSSRGCAQQTKTQWTRFLIDIITIVNKWNKY